MKDVWQKNHEIVWFTDESKTIDGTGAALHNDSYENSIPLGNWTTVFQTGVIAINTCAQKMEKDGLIYTSIIICSDSQAGLKALDKTELNSKLVWECYENLQRVGENNDLALSWVPGHYGIEGNEKLNWKDQLAHESRTVVFEPGISLSTVRTDKEDWVNSELESCF